jgi:hypothetical protein
MSGPRHFILYVMFVWMMFSCASLGQCPYCHRVLLLCYCSVYHFHADCCVVVSISLLANWCMTVWLVSYHLFLSTCVCSWCIIYLWQLFLLNHSGHWDAYLLSRVLNFLFIHHPLSCQLLIVLCVWCGTWLGLSSDSRLIWTFHHGSWIVLHSMLIVN